MRIKPLVCRELKKTYLKATFERDAGHPQNRGYEAIQDFKGMRPVKLNILEKKISQNLQTENHNF